MKRITFILILILHCQCSGAQFKCALHVHTNLNDKYAVLSPNEVMAAYHALGFDAIVITDHDRIWNGKTEYKGMAVISGQEKTDHDKFGAYHVVEFGGGRILAHPKWSGMSEEVFWFRMKTCDAFEAFNALCRVKHYKWRPDLAVWPGKGVYVDDMHWTVRLIEGKEINMIGVGITSVTANDKSGIAIMDAIKAGNYTILIK